MVIPKASDAQVGRLSQLDVNMGAPAEVRTWM